MLSLPVLQVVVLDCVAHGGVGGAVAVVGAAAFHHFEEHTAHGGRIEVEEFAVRVPVIQQVQFLQRGQEVRCQAEACVQVLVVVRRDLQELQAAGLAVLAR